MMATTTNHNKKLPEMTRQQHRKIIYINLSHPVKLPNIQIFGRIYSK